MLWIFSPFCLFSSFDEKLKTLKEQRFYQPSKQICGLSKSLKIVQVAQRPDWKQSFNGLRSLPRYLHCGEKKPSPDKGFSLMYNGGNDFHSHARCTQMGPLFLDFCPTRREV